ncbi:MAG: heme-binding protein [Acidimicrobiia bacterium]
MSYRHELSHRQAHRIINAVQAALDERKAGAAVAVVDPHGELIALLRTDGCPLASINNAIHKAFTAARERVDSAVVGERSRTEGFPMTNFGDLRYTAWGGGVPVYEDGEVTGAVGVSGLSEEEDIELARLGAAAADAAA